jgi:hypothetical protein
MARKRKQTEQAPVTLEELPHDAEALTDAEAEATKGGSVAVAFAGSMGVIGPADSPADPTIPPHGQTGFELLEPENPGRGGSGDPTSGGPSTPLK